MDRSNRLRDGIEAAADEVADEIGGESVSVLAVAVAPLMDLSREVVRRILFGREQREAHLIRAEGSESK